MPMVPLPAAGGSALGRYLRFLVLERERDKEIELERERERERDTASKNAARFVG